jgi:hypothetical protein
MWRPRMHWYCRDCWWQGLTDPAAWPPVLYVLCPQCRSDDLRSVPVQMDDWAEDDDIAKEAEQGTD